MATPVKKTGSKKAKRNVPNGVVHIQSTFNNTIVSITDTSGEVISWSSAGATGFKGHQIISTKDMCSNTELRHDKEMDNRLDPILLDSLKDNPYAKRILNLKL